MVIGTFCFIMHTRLSGAIFGFFSLHSKKKNDNCQGFFPAVLGWAVPKWGVLLLLFWLAPTPPDMLLIRNLLYGCNDFVILWLLCVVVRCSVYSIRLYVQ